MPGVLLRRIRNCLCANLVARVRGPRQRTFSAAGPFMRRGVTRMKSIGLGRYALGGFATAAMLAAGGGSQPPIGVPATMPQIAPLFSTYPVTSEPSATGGQNVQTSWMRKGSQKDDLLYLTQ